MKQSKKMRKLMAECIAAGLAGALCLFGPGAASQSVYGAGQPVKINAANFPDPVFRQILSTADYDRDGNGTLDVEEIGLTINIHCEGTGVKSLKGVEYFTDLQGLWCKDNQIASLDVSKNKDLRGLWCSGNPLTELDLTANAELLWVYCYDCKLKALDVTKNPKMAFIECNTNPITELDLSNNPQLEHLTCGTCKLKELDLSHNPKLAHVDAFSNKLKKLDVSHNPKMKRLDIWNNEGLGSIDISQNPGLQYYNCANNDVTSIDVSHNPELNKLICSYNSITKLDLSKNPKLVYLDCACNQIGNLDLTKNPKLRFLQAFTNSFKTLNIGENPYLVKTYKEGKKKDESAVCKGHSWTINYGGDTSTGGDNIFFLCIDDAVKLKTKGSGSRSQSTQVPPGESVDPKNLITREVFAQMLYEMAGSPDVKGFKSSFSDAEPGAFYEKALLWGEHYHICTGYPDISSDTFGVGEWLTRQDLALMLMRYSEFAGYERSIDFGRSDDYLDYYDIDFDHWEAICWTATWNLMDGKGAPGSSKEEQRIDPLGAATREDVKTVVSRMLEKNQVPTGKFESIFKSVLKKAPESYAVKDAQTNASYLLTTQKGNTTLKYVYSLSPDQSSAVVPDVVTVSGKKIKVTETAPQAFLNNKKLKKITIGKNIKKIGKKAFYGCKKLKSIKIRTTKLKKKTVGKDAFKRIHAKATVTVPKKKLTAYRKFLKDRGINGAGQKIQ